MIEPGWFVLGLAVVSAVITAATAVATRPSRKEVNEMIDIKVDHRLGKLEKDVTEMKADVKTLLERTARISTKRK